MADENKTLLGLLNGLARRDYYNDSDITEDFLKDELYPELSNDEFKLIVQRATGLIKVGFLFNYVGQLCRGLVTIGIGGRGRAWPGKDDDGGGLSAFFFCKGVAQ